MNNSIALTEKKQEACVDSQGVFMIGAHQSQRLTCAYLAFILCSLSQKTKVWAATPEKTGHKRPLLNVVFLCPPETQAAALRRVLFIMAGYFRQTLKSLAGACTGCCNLIYSATQYLQLLRGGYSLYTGVTA